MYFFFFFNDTATTEIYTLSLHDALPISHGADVDLSDLHGEGADEIVGRRQRARSEEHTSELQSPCNLVCRLLLEKKKKLRVDLPTQPDSIGNLVITSVLVLKEWPTRVVS